MAHDFTPDTLFGTTVTGSDGDKIGKVDEVFLDNRTGQPEWVSVKTGLFGSNVSLLPLSAASLSGDVLTVPFDKSKVKDAPHHDPGRELSESDEDDLYRYYGIADTSGTTTGTTTDTTTGLTGTDVTGTATTGTTGTATTGTTGTGDLTTGHTHGTGHAAGHDTSGPDTDNAMTRSKEELHVGTETREAGRARLRKYITSENVSRTVPVSHEEVVVTREPITEANRGAALSGGDLTEEEHEVVLTEERAVAAKETVPVERVQLGTETVTSEETVEATVREEVIDVDADTTVDATRGRDDRR
ncbi:DUF2382 domain-containing protein [Kineococcus sp. SYSU DK002]|uniref:DUF2382 domain-containing protein n=1 Tax=Kineococcus sp. SYSU DK002 TaxID=3383123 RepID=UPI003D7C5CCB